MNMHKNDNFMQNNACFSMHTIHKKVEILEMPYLQGFQGFSNYAKYSFCLISGDCLV